MLPLWALKQNLALKLLHDSCGLGLMAKGSSGSLTEAGGAAWVAGKEAVCDRPKSSVIAASWRPGTRKPGPRWSMLLQRLQQESQSFPAAHKPKVRAQAAGRWN
jgi:hypothetical protein